MFVHIPFWDDCFLDTARIGAQQARASHLAMQQVDVARMRWPWAMGLGVGPRPPIVTGLGVQSVTSQPWSYAVLADAVIIH